MLPYTYFGGTQHGMGWYLWLSIASSLETRSTGINAGVHNSNDDTPPVTCGIILQKSEAPDLMLGHAAAKHVMLNTRSHCKLCRF